MPRGERKTNWLWIWGRAANVILGTVLTLAGVRLYSLGGVGWCPFQRMPDGLTSIIGGGFVVGGVLLLPARTAPFALPCLAFWALLWTWVPSGVLRDWGHETCWEAATLLAALCLNMCLMDLAETPARLRPTTKTVLFFGMAYLAAAAVLWLRGR